MGGTLHDVHLWATENDDDRDARYELLKAPARLSMHDDDPGLIPADTRYFENIIAASRCAGLEIGGCRYRAAARQRAGSGTAPAVPYLDGSAGGDEPARALGHSDPLR